MSRLWILVLAIMLSVMNVAVARAAAPAISAGHCACIGAHPGCPDGAMAGGAACQSCCIATLPGFAALTALSPTPMAAIRGSIRRLPDRAIAPLPPPPRT